MLPPERNTTPLASGLAAPFGHPAYAPAARIADILRRADNILVTAHANPDGDAAGAMVALGHGLKSLGKRVALCNATGFPNYLEWLPWQGRVYKRPGGLPFRPELAVTLDCGDAARLGRTVAEPLAGMPTVNIDHHLGNPLFGSVDNWVEPRMAATGQMAAAILECLGVPLQGAVAEAVYVALSTDTGGFAFDNTTPEVFDLMAHLMRQGLDMPAVRRHMDNQWSQPRMRLWGQLLQSFSLHGEGRVALAAVPLATLAACGAMKEDLEGFAEQLRRLRGVDVAALLREDTPARCKISLRSTGPVDVRAMAVVFGGGGHRNAAGATLDMPLDRARQALLDAIGNGLEPSAAGTR